MHTWRFTSKQCEQRRSREKGAERKLTIWFAISAYHVPQSCMTKSDADITLRDHAFNGKRVTPMNWVSLSFSTSGLYSMRSLHDWFLKVEMPDPTLQQSVSVNFCFWRQCKCTEICALIIRWHPCECWPGCRKYKCFTSISCMSSAPQNRFEAVGGKQLQENQPFQGKKLQCAKTTRNKTSEKINYRNGNVNASISKRVVDDVSIVLGIQHHVFSHFSAAFFAKKMDSCHASVRSKTI